MPSIQITVPDDKGGQKFTIGEIARMILETHESSPTVDAQVVITEILSQAEVGEPPGIKPDKEIILLASAGHPYESAASATRAARTRADLQGIDWDIVSVDGGWAIRDISIYTNWFEYWADKDALPADEISYKVLVSTAEMTRLCRSTGYREWASPLGLGVPVMFGGEGTPLAKGQEDAPGQTLPPQRDGWEKRTNGAMGIGQHLTPKPVQPKTSLAERRKVWADRLEKSKKTSGQYRPEAEKIAGEEGLDSIYIEREARRVRATKRGSGEK